MCMCIYMCWYCVTVTIHEERLLPDTVYGNNVACRILEILMTMKGINDVLPHHAISSFVIK